MTPPAPNETNTQEKSFWANTELWIRTHQNIVFFVLLVITLLVVLVVWRSYRINQMSDKAWYDVEKANDSNALQMILQVHGITKAAPFIRLKLANAYFDEGKLAEAKKEYETIIANYPKEDVAKWAKLRLDTLAINETWKNTELDKQIKEYIAKRGVPNVTIKTTQGEFEVELFEDEAPNTVANFISLAEKGSYNQTLFSDIKPDMGLCLSDKGITPTYYLPYEVNNLKHEEGSLGMIRERDPNPKLGLIEDSKYTNSATTRFFITLQPTNPGLDEKYTAFGRVTKGMDIVKQLTKDSSILQVVINYKRPHEYAPKTLKYEPLPKAAPLPPIPLPPPQVTPVTPTPVAPVNTPK
ncbi:MAG: peptidylprolyl isomerase [Candidatus Brocadiia bacterium]